MVLEAKGESSRTEKWLIVSNARRRASTLKMKKKKSNVFNNKELLLTLKGRF